MRNVADFVTRVLASLPRTTRNELVQLAVRDSINEFMRQSRICTDEFHMPLENCQRTVEFIVDMPDCRKLVEMQALWAAPNNCTTGRRDATWSQIPKAHREFGRGWWVITHGEHNIALRVNEWHGRTSMMAVEYAFTIARDGCEVPDVIYEEWFDAIKEGARARIFNDPDSDSYNPRAAALAETAFDNHITEAKVRARLNYGGGYEICPQSIYTGTFGG